MTVKYTIFRRNLRLLIQLLLVIAFLAMAFVARSQTIVNAATTDNFRVSSDETTCMQSRS